MNKNIKIAKQLIKLAKSLISFQRDQDNYDDYDSENFEHLNERSRLNIQNNDEYQQKDWFEDQQKDQQKDQKQKNKIKDKKFFQGIETYPQLYKKMELLKNDKEKEEYIHLNEEQIYEICDILVPTIINKIITTYGYNNRLLTNDIEDIKHEIYKELVIQFIDKQRDFTEDYKILPKICERLIHDYVKNNSVIKKDEDDYGKVPNLPVRYPLLPNKIKKVLRDALISLMKKRYDAYLAIFSFYFKKEKQTNIKKKLQELGAGCKTYDGAKKHAFEFLTQYLRENLKDELQDYVEQISAHRYASNDMENLLEYFLNDKDLWRDVEKNI